MHCITSNPKARKWRGKDERMKKKRRKREKEDNCSQEPVMYLDK
jgi:hypothetical protein